MGVCQPGPVDSSGDPRSQVARQVGDEPHSIFLPPVLRLAPDLHFLFACVVSLSLIHS